jgi:L-asparaginase
MPVVVASRTRAGAVLTRTYGSPGAELHLLGRGCVPSGLLTAIKARVLLVLLLRSGYSRPRAEAWLLSEGSQRAVGDSARVQA